jgi:hypothetical protein
MISELQDQLSRIRQQIAQEQEAQAVAAWEQAKQNAREAKSEVGRLRGVFSRAQAEWMTYERECGKVKARLDEHTQSKPQDDDFPTPEELKNWEKERQRLVRLLTGPMLTRRSDLKSVMEHARIDVIKADQQYILLGYAERNARTKVIGLSETGVNRVAI